MASQIVHRRILSDTADAFALLRNEMLRIFLVGPPVPPRQSITFGFRLLNFCPIRGVQSRRVVYLARSMTKFVLFSQLYLTVHCLNTYVCRERTLHSSPLKCG